MHIFSEELSYQNGHLLCVGFLQLFNRNVYLLLFFIGMVIIIWRWMVPTLMFVLSCSPVSYLLFLLGDEGGEDLQVRSCTFLVAFLFL